MNQDDFCKEFSGNARAIQTALLYRMILGVIFGDIELAANMSSKLGPVRKEGPYAIRHTRGFQLATCSKG
jgi:hypothetical protein